MRSNTQTRQSENSTNQPNAHQEQLAQKRQPSMEEKNATFFLCGFCDTSAIITCLPPIEHQTQHNERISKTTGRRTTGGECKHESRLFLPLLQPPLGAIFNCIEVRSMSRFTRRVTTLWMKLDCQRQSIFKSRVFFFHRGPWETQRNESKQIR